MINLQEIIKINNILKELDIDYSDTDKITKLIELTQLLSINTDQKVDITSKRQISDTDAKELSKIPGLMQLQKFPESSEINL